MIKIPVSMTIKASLLKLLDDGRVPGEFLSPKGTINQSALARALGIEPAAVNQWFSGATKWPHPSLQRQLAKILKVPLNEVGEPGTVDFDMLSAPPGAPSGSRPFPIAEIAKAPRSLPVRRTGGGSDDGSFLFYAHEAVDYMHRPAALENAKDAFAIYLEGDSMEPWAVAGDPLAINPSRPPAPGSHVLIELYPEAPGGDTRAMVKKLVGRTGRTIIVAQYNPVAQMEISADRVKAIYRILERRDLMPG